MRLTTMTDYALRLLIYLGSHPERLCTTAEVASAYEISEAHMTKITHQLGLGGWIHTVRGKGGGMRLAGPAEEIRVGAVVRATEETLAPADCLDAARHSDCRLLPSCRLQGVLRDAQRAFLQHLDGYTLRDLLNTRPPPAVVPLLRLQRSRRPARRPLAATR